jgi:large conductance mechanosensitive channel
MIREFRAFLMRGNVLDLAVAVIIGAAFGGIVNSLVNDLVMPVVGLIAGRVDFSDRFLSLDGKAYATLAAAEAAGAPTLNYGLFLQAVVNFVIIAAVIFVVVRIANRLQQPAAPEEATTKSCPFCVSTIPVAATRCPQCTSQLSMSSSAAE